MEFTDPLHISKGDEPDYMRLTFPNPELFVSAVTGKELEDGTLLEKAIPR